MPCCLNTSVIKPRQTAVFNPLRSIGFYLKKERSEWKATLKTTRMSNFVHIETFVLKPNQLLDDRELGIKLLFLSLLTPPIDKNSHILAAIYFIFLKHFLKQTWKSFNTKFQPQWKYQKSSYQAKQILALFCNLIFLILG